MKIPLRDNKDFYAGLLFIVTGAGSMFIARDYPFGSALRMGPGYFPSVLGGILVAFGIYVAAKGIRTPEKLDHNWSLRALIVLPLATVLFGFLMEETGFIPAMIVLIFAAAAAGRQFKIGEVLLLTIAMTVACVGVFIYGLGLPYQLLKGL